jgi:putative sterol carrier protein
MSAELATYGIAVNTLWPRTAIWTAAMDMLSAGSGADMCRKEDIMSDAAYAIVSRDARKFTGQFCVDEEVLTEEGIKDFEQYAVKPGNPLMADFFLPAKYTQGLFSMFGKPLKRSFSTSCRSYSSDSSSSDLSPEKLFEKVSQKFNDDLKNEINSVMSFVISGNHWTIDAHSSRPFKITATEAEKPDVTFIMDEEVFIKMAKGEVKAANAFMSGKLKVKGNLGIAMKAEKIFKQIRE